MPCRAEPSRCRAAGSGGRRQGTQPWCVGQHHPYWPPSVVMIHMSGRRSRSCLQQRTRRRQEGGSYHLCSHLGHGHEGRAILAILPDALQRGAQLLHGEEAVAWRLAVAPGDFGNPGVRPLREKVMIQRTLPAKLQRPVHLFFLRTLCLALGRQLGYFQRVRPGGTGTRTFEAPAEGTQRCVRDDVSAAMVTTMCVRDV